MLVLLGAVLILGLTDTARAVLVPLNDYSFSIGWQRFGIVDWTSSLAPGPPPIRTILYLGPLGSLQVPFTATRGVAGFGVLLTASLFAVLLLRQKGKRDFIEGKGQR